MQLLEEISYHYSLRNSLEDRGSHLRRGGSLQSRIRRTYFESG